LFAVHIQMFTWYSHGCMQFLITDFTGFHYI
jgi:hypothetical protein